MTALDLIQWASREDIDLNIRDGRLFVRAPGTIPPDLSAAIRAHKPAVIACLEDHATNAMMREDCLRRCLPLTPADLTAAEHLAHDLTAAGTLGHFVVDLCAGWTALDVRDRVAACLAWQTAAEPVTVEHAA
jgi:AcrR family transcriptional regulator